jgi:hypothetical protein
MSAPLQLGLVTRSVGAERAVGQPGGLPDISRGLSASDTPGTPSKTNRTLEGCQNSSSFPVALASARTPGTPPGCSPIAFAVRGYRLTPFGSTPG